MVSPPVYRRLLGRKRNAPLQGFHEETGREGHWFPAYRNEIGYASYSLYHECDWAKAVWAKIEAAELASLQTTLAITPEENGLYRDRVAKKHRESDPNDQPAFFTRTKTEAFATQTAARYKTWIEGRP